MRWHMKGMEGQQGEVPDVPADVTVPTWCSPESSTPFGVDLAPLAKRDGAFPLPPSPSVEPLWCFVPNTGANQGVCCV